MLSLLSPLRLMSIVAVGYALLVVLVLLSYMAIFRKLEAWPAIKIAFSGALGLDIFLLVAVHFLWRWLWVKIPILNTILFPDLNGRWKMKIHWVSPDANGTVSATAIIRQDLLHISMEVASEGSDSETLMAKPKKDPESGRPLLYYVYRVVPKQVHHDVGLTYEGAAILKFEPAQTHCLSGNYFTSRRTVGHFVLQRE